MCLSVSLSVSLGLCSLSEFLNAFCVADSGFRFGQWNKFLLCQWLCRLLYSRDLDGAADRTALSVDFRIRPAHDHAAKHHGSIWRPKRSIDFSASVRMKCCQTQTLLCLSVPPWEVLPCHVAFVSLGPFLWRAFPLIFSPVVFFPELFHSRLLHNVISFQAHSPLSVFASAKVDAPFVLIDFERLY